MAAAAAEVGVMQVAVVWAGALKMVAAKTVDRASNNRSMGNGGGHSSTMSDGDDGISSL